MTNKANFTKMTSTSDAIEFLNELVTRRSEADLVVEAGLVVEADLVIEA